MLFYRIIISDEFFSYLEGSWDGRLVGCREGCILG